MSLLAGWLAADPGTVSEEREAHGRRVVAAMGRALRCHAGQRWACWSAGALTVGLLELAEPWEDREKGAAIAKRYNPAVAGGDRFHLWFAGEAFAARGELAGRLDPGAASDLLRFSRTQRFRRLLLDALLELGPGEIGQLDGHYLVALWDRVEGRLTLLNDRFGIVPCYHAASRDGFAFASGVRAVLAAPGIAADPDLEALRDAVTFGGFRLGRRTLVAAVEMLPGAARLTVGQGGPPPSTAQLDRTWLWEQVELQNGRAQREPIERAHALWCQAIGRRLDQETHGQHPGQTLSGGLDSRAILGEAVRRTEGWTAVSYGVADCDDLRYAGRAAAAAGARWIQAGLYGDDWLERRSAMIQSTDGLLQLVDLMHMEPLPLLATELGVLLPGIYGDPVCGTTYDGATDAAGVLAGLPYYGGRLSRPWDEAMAWAEEAIAQLGDAQPRFAIFEHKFPQSVNRIFQSYAPWVRVRMPFTDHDLFDFFSGQPAGRRLQLYHGLLDQRYPELFAAIPYQTTGLPLGAPAWRLTAERGRRYLWRRFLQPTLAGLGLPARPRRRSYHAEEVHWRRPEARRQIEKAILRPGSLACGIFGRPAVEETVTGWFERLDCATQVIGALYVYECYHRDLAGFLAERRNAERPA